MAGGKQRAGPHADAFEGLAVTQAAGLAAVGSWYHTTQVPGKARIMSSEEASLFNVP